MRGEIRLKERVIGFAAGAALPGAKVPVVSREFTSSEDGSLFVSRLEGFQGSLISQVPDCPPPSFIDTFLAVIHPDLRTTVIVNELSAHVSVRAKRAVKAGDLFRLDDVLDITRKELSEPIPEECGLVLIESFGWRKSLFFDLEPLTEDGKRRDFDLGLVLGSQHAYLLFQEQLRITDHQWEELFKQHWFPFRFLPFDTLKTVLNRAGERWDIDEILSDEKVMAALELAADSNSALLASPFFADHRQLIAHAFERFRAKDYKSTVAILFPRIEGVLRSIHAGTSTGNASASALVVSSTATFEQKRGDATLLMPSKFREYLDRVYFRGWHPGQPPSHVSRHTVSHGVAPESEFNKKAAVVAVLTVLQLALYL
jgi:hypothetical protein